jgi:hypothetical protein
MAHPKSAFAELADKQLHDRPTKDTHPIRGTLEHIVTARN